jgi:hydroxymethylpyrimidine pyrophosphatase-like HAD family hydrolase
MAVRLIAVDVDAALAGSTHALKGAGVDAVAAVRRSGVEIVLVSALGARMLRGILRQLRLFEPTQFIAAQGALTGALAPDGVLRVVHESAMPLAAAHELVATADAVGLTTSWFRGFDWFVPRVDDTVAAQATTLNASPVVRHLATLTRPPEQLMIIATPEKAHYLQAIAARLPRGLTAHPSGSSCLAITASGVCLSGALERMRTRLGLDADEVATVRGRDIAGALINLLCT